MRVGSHVCMLQGLGCDTLRLKCSKLKGKFKYGNRGITPAINVYYSPADVEAFTFLDSESPATTSTYTISLEFMQQSCKVFFLFKIKKKKQCTGYECTPGGSPPTGLPATDNYLAKISEGAGKTGSAGSSGNTPGSSTFSPPEGAFLTGGIIQGDSKSGQARADR